MKTGTVKVKKHKRGGSIIPKHQRGPRSPNGTKKETAPPAALTLCIRLDAQQAQRLAEMADAANTLGALMSPEAFDGRNGKASPTSIARALLFRAIGGDS